MCGINTIYRKSGLHSEDRHTIRKMNQEMAYRGPDGEGNWADSNFAAGMVRLSIIDLEGGQQPIFNETESLAIVCNGEIYNYLELREGLQKKGHRFSTGSDVEVILHLYEEMGTACVSELRGMFAFVIWDRNSKTVFGARDRIGEKSLYFVELKDGYAFSSELKTLQKFCLETPAELEMEVLKQTFQFSYPVEMRQTHIRQIKRVLPAERFIIGDGKISFQKYWKPAFNQSYQGSLNNAVEDLRNALSDAVKISTRSDVPVGVLLSGGIDSSMIAALAAENGSNVQAITAGYEGNHDCDEREAAKAFARRLKLPWHSIELSEANFENYFKEFMRVLDEPVADPASIPQWGIYKAAKEMGIKVLLTGIGGDELFFGYPIWNRAGEIGDIRRSLNRAAKESVWKAISEVYFRLPKIAFLIRSLFQRDSTGMLWHPGFAQKRKMMDGIVWGDSSANLPRDATEDFLDESLNGYDQISSILLSTWLPSNCLYLGDRLGMGNSVEVRSPLLDVKLMDLVFSLPISWRYLAGQTKPLLKNVIKGLVPDEILFGKKRGFTPPYKLIQKLSESYSLSPVQFSPSSFEGAVINLILRDYYRSSELRECSTTAA